MPCNAGAVHAWMKIVVLFRTERAKSGYGYLYLHDANNFLKSLMPWKDFHKLRFSRICIARTAVGQSGKR